MSLLFFVVPMGSAEDVKAERREHIDAEFNAQAETEEEANVASKRVGESLLAHEASESNLGEANVAENIPENGNNDTENIPTEIRGKEEREAFHLVPVERTTEELYNSDLDQQEIDAFVQANIDEINRDIEKHSKKQPKMGANIAAYKAAKERWQARSADLNARLSYYQSLQQHIADITRSEMGEAKRAAGEQAENISTPTELVAGYLEGIKITPDSFKRETGLGSAEQKALVGIIATEKAGGVSVERAAEIIAENYAEELAGAGFNGDIQDIRNMIIEVLADGNPRTYANRGRRQRSQQAAEQQIGEMEAFTRATFGMELDEYIAYEETILPRIIEQYANFDEQTYYSILADENYNNHDTTRESETTGRGSEILQGEQSVPASGTASLRAGNEGRTVSNDVQSGNESTTAQGENQIGEPVGETDTLSSSEIPNNQFVAEGVQAEASEQAPSIPQSQIENTDGNETGAENGNENQFEQQDEMVEYDTKDIYTLSELADNEGNRFYQKNDSIDLWDLSPLFEQARRQNAPIRLTERNVNHILDEHKKELGDSEESVIEFLNNVFSNATVLRKARAGGIFVVVNNTKTDKAAIIRLYPSKNGDYYNVESAGYYRKNKWKDSENVIAELSEPTQSVTASDVSKPQVPEEGGRELLNAETATTSADEDTAPVSNSQENEQKSGENSQSEGEQDVIDEVREQNRIADERVKRAGYPPRFSDYSTAIANGDTEAMKQWEDKFNTYLGAMNADDLPALESTIREMQGRKSEIKAGNPEGYKENPNYKAFDYIEKALKSRKQELEQLSNNVEKSQEVEDKSTNDGDVSTLSQESDQVSDEDSAFISYVWIAPAQYTTKKGKVLDMYLVKFVGTLTKEKQRAVEELVKANRGWYDRERDGFMMHSEESADQLADTIISDEEAVSDAGQAAELQQGALTLDRENPAFKAATEQTMQALEKTGVEVVMATPEMVQAVMGLAEMQKRTAPETESVQEEHQPSVVSSTDGAKVLKDLDSAIKEYDENANKRPNTFLGDIAKVLKAKKHGSNSQYATFEAVNGKVFTIRLANHNAKTSTFDKHDENEGISIVVTAQDNSGITNDGNAHLVEFFYDAIKLRKADGKPLVEILKSIKQALYSGEYIDNTGLAVREEVNVPEFHRVYHGSGAKFDRFNHSFMGTGEGVQAYGWGTYVTEVKGIGKQYARSVVDGDIQIHIDAKKDFIKQRKRNLRDSEDYDKYSNRVLKNRRANEREYKAALKAGNEKDAEFYKGLIELCDEQLEPKNHAELIESFKEDIRKAENEIKSLQESVKGKHQLYTVEIPDDNGSNYLRWEEVISDEVIDKLQNELQKEFGEDTAWNANLKHGQSGEHLYKKLERALGSDKAASLFLSDMGFVGISYPAEATTGGREDGARNYVIFNENDALITDHVAFLRTADGTVYGWTVGGKIYLTPEGVNPNTPVHEYTHLWASAIERSDPKLWASIVRGMKQSPVWNEIAADEAYRDIWNDENRMASEVLSRLTGEENYRRAMERAEAEIKSAPNPTEAAKKITIWERVKRALNDFWNKVKTILDQPATGKPKGDEPEWMEFVSSAIGDFYKGVNPNVENPGVEFAKRESERRKEKNRVNSILDEAVGFFTIGGKRQAAKNRLKREAERKQLAEEIYTAVLKGDFNDVTLERINKYIEDATPNNPFGNRISQRLPQRMERALRARERTSAVDALFSRISESAVPANGRFSEAGRRAIEEKKKELLQGWAIATGNWHTDLKEFTDDIEPIGEGKDSKVYTSKDGRYVIKASKGKPLGKKFRPDIDNIPLFNDVFPNSRYEILGYGEIDGEFVRILKQPIVDFAESTPLTPEERAEYMSKLGFKPLNKDYTAFSDGEIVIADLQKSNIVKDAEGNVRVIDADAKLHTKDVGGSYTYPAVETDLPGKSSPNQRALKITENFNRTHKGAAATVIIDNNGTLDEQLRLRGFAEDDIDTAIKMFDNGTIAAYFPTDDRVLIFNSDASESEINGYLWHENAHRAIGELYTDEEVETIFKNVVGEQEQDIRSEFAGMNYEESQQAEEFVVRLLEDLYLAHPDLVESGKFKVNDDDFKWNVAVDSIKPLINYINNGDREKARSDIDTRLGAGLRIFNVEVESEKALEVRNSGTQKQDEQRTERYTDSIEDVDNISNSQEAGDIRYRSIGGNSGYVGYSMSKRAAEAREEGRFPKTDFKKEYNMPGSTFDALVAAGIIDNGEWHHTSKFGNKTVFYGWADDAYADFYAEHKAEVDAMAKGENIDGSLFVAEVEENPYTEQRVIIPEGYWEQRRSLENEGMTYDGIDEILKERFPELYAASENNRKFHEFESEISSARYENEKIISNRLTALFDEDRGGVMFRGDDSIEAANERFNRELDAFKEKRHKGLLHLGRPGAVLSAAGVNAEELTLSPSVLFQHLKKHNLTTEDLKGLAEAVQSPILVYRHGETQPHLVVVTELEAQGGKLSVALRLDENGNVVEVSNVSSVHSKDAATELDRLSILGEEKLQDYLRWVEKEKVSDWLGLPYEEERQNTDPKLISVANVIENFENPSIEEDLLQNEDVISGLPRRVADREITDAVTSLAARLNTGVEIITSTGEITDDDAERLQRKRASKGWYEPKSGKVVIVLPNNFSVQDAVETVLHEVVGHDGLRRVFGRGFDRFLDDVFMTGSTEVCFGDVFLYYQMIKNFCKFSYYEKYILHLQCKKKKGALAHLARAFDWQSKGDEFESRMLHKKRIYAINSIDSFLLW